MKKLILAITLATLTAAAMPQGEEGKPPPTPPQVNLSANMMDIRTVINTIFAQVRKSYVIENGIMGSINVGLVDVEFDEALIIVCKLANLKHELQNGIHYFSKIKATPPKSTEPPKTAVNEEPPKPKGPLPASALQKRITTRLDKTDIRAVFAELSKQTGIEFEITSKVPSYKLDAYLIDTSLKFALDTIVKAAGLEYKLTDDMSIRIDKSPGTVKVSG